MIRVSAPLVCVLSKSGGLRGFVLRLSWQPLLKALTWPDTDKDGGESTGKR